MARDDARDGMFFGALCSLSLKNSGHTLRAWYPTSPPAPLWQLLILIVVREAAVADAPPTAEGSAWFDLNGMDDVLLPCTHAAIEVNSIVSICRRNEHRWADTEHAMSRAAKSEKA